MLDCVTQPGVMSAIPGLLGSAGCCAFVLLVAPAYNQMFLDFDCRLPTLTKLMLATWPPVALNPHVARERFERLTTAFVEAFSNLTGRTPHEIRDAMATNHSFMGSTARDFGFVDLLSSTSTC